MSRVVADLGMEPLAFVVWRALIATAAFFVFAAFSVARWGKSGLAPLANFRRIPRRRQVALAAGIVLSAFLNVSIFAAYQRMAIAVVLITFYTFPALVTLGAVPLYGDRLDARRLAALTLSLGGLALVLLAPMISGGAGLTVDPLAVGLALFAAACQTTFILITGRGYAPMKPAEMAFWLVAVGVIIGAPALAIFGDFGSLAAPSQDPLVWPWVLFAGICGAAIPTVWLMGGLARIGPSRTAILMTFEPLVGVTLASLLLAERPVPLQIVGGVAVIVAAVVLQAAPSAAPRETEVPLA